MKISWSQVHGDFILDELTPSDTQIAKDSGFVFMSASAQWHGNADAVERVKVRRLQLEAPISITELALERFRDAGKAVLTAVEESRAVDSDIEIPVPFGLEYLPFQKAGIAYAIKRPDVLIGDSPGLGKTISAIGISNCLPNARRILIICPAFLKPMWRNKFQEWDVKGLSVGIAEGVKNPVLPNTDVVILNYDILKAYREPLRNSSWDILIGDEIHKLKNSRADRTREVFGGIKRDKDKRIVDRVSPIPVSRRIFLSGTPSLNGKPKELWNLVKELDPEGLGADWFAYAKRYCGLFEIKRFNPSTNQQERVGWKWDSSDNLPELQERMRAKFLVRRLKDQVLKELPPKRRMVVPLAVTGRKAQRLQKEWQEFNKYARSGDDSFFETPAFGDMSTKMLETGLMLVDPTIEIVKEDLNEYDKIVIMCYHKEVAEKIAEAFPNISILVTGDMVPAKRYEAVNITFQTNSKINVLVGTIGSCSEGLEAFAAHLMIFPERCWEPGGVTQSEDRIHRRGQLGQCLYKHLVLEGSLSEHQTKLLIAKQEILDKMLDRETEKCDV